MKVTPGWPTSLIASSVGTVSIWLLASSTICCTVFFILSGIGYPSRCSLVLNTEPGCHGSCSSGSASVPLDSCA